ncbi:MAG: hypothetical protein IIZ92_21590 [Aquincola sp.]|nr:hypothetical protein [Aquincola sp.]
MDLSALIAAAWEQHADDAEATARRIAEMLPQVQAAADVPPFAALLAHVYGEHLGQWPQALALLARTLMSNTGSRVPMSKPNSTPMGCGAMLALL